VIIALLVLIGGSFMKVDDKKSLQVLRITAMLIAIMFIVWYLQNYLG